MKLKERIQSRPLLLDGAQGTFLQNCDITPEQWGDVEGCNEWLNLSAPDVIRGLHRAYFEAGSDAVETNTFGASPITLGEYNLSDRAYEINKAAAALAREVADEFSTDEQPRYIIGSIGPGTKLPSLGHITFDELLAAYKIQIQGLVDGGVDGLIIETCQDPLQIKAALSAADDILGPDSDIVRYVSVTIETTGTLLVGTSPAAAAAILAPYPIDVLGLNCATGPDAMKHHLDTFNELWPAQLACMPNAGMPEARADGSVHYPLQPEEFAEKVGALAREHGLSIVGGCCGTTPRHIAELRKQFSNDWNNEGVEAQPPSNGWKIREPAPAPQQAASLFSAVELTQEPAPLYIGERANATGSRKFRDTLLSNDYENAFHILTEQEETGAHVLDLSCGYAGRDERKDIEVLVPRMARECTAPMMIDSTSADVIEDALKCYGGRAMINSINFEDGGERAERVVPLAKRFGASLVGLTIDEKGMAMNADEKFAIAKQLVEFCVERGLRAEDLLIDPLTFTICSGDDTLRDAAFQTLEAIRRIKAELPGVRTMLGLSNISFGLKPALRKVLNAVFLHQAVEAGMDACIINVAAIVPLNEIPDELRKGAEALLANDTSNGDPLENYINLFENVVEESETSIEERPADEVLRDAIIRGKIPWLEPAVPDLLKEQAAEDILNNIMLPAMKEVGRLFNDGIMQLPFVLKSAEVMKRAVDMIKPFMTTTEADETVPLVVLATVAGDVHDIGKNLVGIILSNNGFDTVDIGIKVPIEQMMQAVKDHNAAALGMSGLLVKSTAVMAENMKVLEQAGFKTPVLLGGAALSEKFVHEACRPHYSGEVLYCKDAFAGLAALQTFKDTGRLPEYVEPTRDGLGCEVPDSGHEEEEQSEPIAQDVPVPDVELDTWITTDIDLDEIWKYLDLDGLIKGAWGYKKGGLSDEEYQKLLDEEVYPNLEKMQELAREIFEPKTVHGFFKCRSEGDHFYLTNPQTGEEIPTTFPRQNKAPHHCLADFFRPDGDVCALTAVTIGHKVMEKEQELRDADCYQDYLLFHGLAIMTAEALNEYMHKQVRLQWGSDEGDLPLREIWKQKLDQSRFGFGYAACPDLEMNKVVCDLLDTERINLRTTELFMCDPEVSTLALVTHHPQSYYFNL
ncbi:methionine synthase [Tichowtungia aerotolerans]|uniref:Methionine synthase n=1 Tax=Tichowtungia aerotolerans TaxID=2697043 RepID=A0A6P1M3L1_9BACT|nr:methionine synthase [Tichowtungia aerotolerans]QHI68411.1 methionine synthase [Tichowtungia aerotolerans]